MNFDWRHETVNAFKWAGVLAIPLLVVFAMFIILTGGPMGSGTLGTLIFLAPMTAMSPILDCLGDGPITWMIASISEYLYLTLIILGCRYLIWKFR